MVVNGFKRKRERKLGIEDARYKAHLVAIGYNKRESVNYNKIFSPVVKHTCICVLAMVVLLELEFDVKIAFQHSKIDETIYMISHRDIVEG